jgi:type VI protein secretion system component VasK
MVILGLILIVLGALAIVCGLFGAHVTDDGKLQFLGQDLSPAALFLIGVGAAVAIWWGLWILKAGSKRSWARRREQKRLEQLSEKLDNVDDRRRDVVDERRDEDRPSL